MSALPAVPNHKTRRAALRLDRLGPELPPPERRQHDPVAIVEERDPEGWPVRHCRTVDTIGRLVRSGLVRSEWAVAADRFRRDYRLAAFDPLSANDLGRSRGAGGHGAIMDRVEDARQRLADAIAGMGGLSAPAGSIVWHVVGAELTLKDWSLRQVWGGRPLRHEVATGLLNIMLGTLGAPHERMRQYKSLSKKLQYGAAAIAAKAFGALFPRQGNSFAMICMKPDAGQGLWPWIEPGQKGPTISRTYVQERYR
jgi:hypothetical protein